MAVPVILRSNRFGVWNERRKELEDLQVKLIKVGAEDAAGEKLVIH